MAELATSIGVIPFTATTSTSSVLRGTRITLNSDGLTYIQTPDATTRGDAIAFTDIPAATAGPAVLANVGRISVIFDSAISSGALAYASATAGQCSPTSTSAALMGRCVQGVTSAGQLGDIQLFSVA